MATLAEILKLLLLATIAIALLRRLRLPPIVGYVLLGAGIGPHALGWVADTGTIHVLGEFGIAFLLFTLGLEFSVSRFASMRRVLLVLGTSQVLACTASGAAVAWAFGLSWSSAIVVGGALSMSSTAIIAKQLSEQTEVQTAHGRLVLGILLFQDLAAIPLLVLIPMLAHAASGAFAAALLLALVKAVAMTVFLLVLGRRALRPVLKEAGSTPELFTLTVLLIALGASWASELSGLSLAFGAFIAGMMLAETEYRHQVEAEIRPFRDVLLGLFFMVVGMELDLKALPAAALEIGVLVSGLIIGKGAVITLLARAYGYRATEAARAGLVLAHGGEFSVALLVLAMSTGLLNAAAIQSILAAVIISMLVAPVIVRRGAWIVSLVVRRGSEDRADTRAAEPQEHLHDHVLVCGYGRLGRQLTRILDEHRFAWVAIDNDPERANGGWDTGGQVYYGDATRRSVLDGAGLERAAAVVLSFDDINSSLRIMQEARSANPAVPVLARAADQRALDALFDAGATEVVPEAIESSLVLATRLLVLLGRPPESVFGHIDSLRADRYKLLRPLR